MRPSRILRIGGTESDTRVLTTVLTRALSCSVEVVGIAAATGLISGRSVDLILVDVSDEAIVNAVMKVASPSDTARNRVPVILTGPQKHEDRIAHLLQSGAEDYMITPLDATKPALVTRRIELCLYRRHLRDTTIRLQALPRDMDQSKLVELYAHASDKFVPREFLELLHRKSLTDVALGDYVQREMSVLFSDIREFTALSERITPKQNFDFLNSYLRGVTPIIRNNGGFVDKYIGDAIMALFARAPEDALRAAVAMQEFVTTYNDGRRRAGYVPIRIGIGLHAGELILGTIGEEERMQTTVISDAVNVAARIEDLTKVFGVGILVSNAVVGTLPKVHTFLLRHLGSVKAKGKSRSVDIYECFNTDSPELRQHKQNNAALFAEGVSEYRKGLFLTAGRIFSRVAIQDPRDTIAAFYRDRCSLAIAHGGIRGDSEIIETADAR